MIESLQSIDLELFRLINGSHVPFWDYLMTAISTRSFWIPGYAAILFFSYKKMGWKGTLVLVGMVLPLILLSDQISASLLKPWIGRLRPCKTLEQVILVTGKCGGKYGFVSSHAANFFALATYLSLMIRFGKPGLPLIFFFSAICVGYSRVYLGVHYPGDVLGGAILGILIGLGVAGMGIWLGRKYVPEVWPAKKRRTHTTDSSFST